MGLSFTSYVRFYPISDIAEDYHTLIVSACETPFFLHSAEFRITAHITRRLYPAKKLMHVLYQLGALSQ